MIVAFSLSPMSSDPTGSVTDAVAAAVRVVRESGLPHETNAMFTNIEGDWDEVMAVVKQAVDVVATIRSGRAENNVAKDVRDAFAAKLSPERFTVEVDDGEDILIKKKDGQPDFAVELIESDVRNVAVKIEGE